MNWRVFCVGWLVPLAGCTLAQTATRNIIHEPKQVVDDRKLDHRLRSEARAALHEVAQKHPRKVFTHEFRDGFEDGFADHLDSGGPCLPPALPPLKYRGLHYLNPEGHAKIRDYFAGFKYGADVAAATGMRPYLTVPVLLADPGPPPPLKIDVLPNPPDGLSTDAPKPVPDASMPLPKPLPVPGPAVPSTPGTGTSSAPLTPLPPPAIPLPDVPKPPAKMPEGGAMIPAPVPIPLNVTLRPMVPPVVAMSNLAPPPTADGR